MSVETEALKLMPHQIRHEMDARMIIVRPDGVEYSVPPAFVTFMTFAEKGTTLAKLADGLRGEEIGSRFSRLAGFLGFLYDADLLADARHVELAESLKPEHIWNPSPALTPWWSTSLMASRRREGNRLSEVAASLFIVIAALESLLAARAPVDVWGRPKEFLLGLLLAFAAGRSLRALAEFFLGWARGLQPALRLRFDLFLFSVENDRVANGAPRGGFVISVISIALCAFATRLDSGSGAITLAALLAFFAEISPFAKSPLTDALRSRYATLGLASGESENRVRRVHVTLSVVWLMALGFGLAIFGPQVGRGWWTALQAADPNSKILLAISGFAIAVLLVSWIFDVATSFSYDETNERDVRRLWRRRPVMSGGISDNAATLIDSLPLLRQLDGDVRRQLLARAKTLEVDEGDAVCRQGDVDRTLYVVLEGRLAVAKRFAVARGSSRRKIVAHLGTGSVFGEAAFFFGHARSADVVAMESTRLLAIPHDGTMKTLGVEKGEELQTRVWFLQALVSNSFLKEIPSEALDAVIHAGRSLRVNAGTRVIQEGEAADSCYFIVQGQASVTQNFKLINKLGAGDAFGEIAVLSSGTFRTATVQADSDLLLVMIEGQAFWDLLRAHLPLAIEIERLARRRIAGDQLRASK